MDLTSPFAKRQVVEVDTYVETDVAYNSGGLSDTNSLRSEVKNYKYENGRRYHAYGEGQYWAPNDDKQNEQLDIFHHVYYLVLDGALYLAPISENPERILDLGTGTGIWAIDMADKFPDTRVIGNDLSPIQPIWVPQNCSFEIDDFTKSWEYPQESFDFIHGRALHGSISNWTSMYREAYTALKHGGWFESVETTVRFFVDDAEGQPIDIDESTATYQWLKFGNEAADKTGKPFDITDSLGGWMKEAGFVNVSEKVFKVPCGRWPKDPKMKNIGGYNLLNLLEALEGFTLALYTRVLRWSPDEVYVLLANVRSELRSKKNNFYFKMHVVYGQRPPGGIDRRGQWRHESGKETFSRS